MEDASQTRSPAPQFFLDAVNASPIGIAVENLEGEPLFVNPAFCSFLGFSAEELCNKHCVDFSPPEDAEKDWALFQQLRAGAINQYQLDKRYYRRDGSLIWGRLRVCLVNSGSSSFVLAMVADITDKRKSEEALQASEERLRLAQQAARIGTFERDVPTGRITWTEGLESLYGLAPGTLEGKSIEFFKRLIHPDDFQRALHMIENALKTGEPSACEWRAIWSDGSTHWIESRWRVSRDKSGNPLRVFGVNMDVTERKQVEQALHVQEELLKIFVKNVPSAVAMLDRDLCYVQASDRWCADYLGGRTEILGRSHYELFPDMPERWKEVHLRALAGETLRADEDHWDGKDGAHWARWEVRPWKTAEGTVGGILILTEDISRRKQMEEALSGMTRKLVEAQEQERSRIGRELHDDVNQRLAMLAVELERLEDDPSEVSSRVRDLRNEIVEISNDVQALSHDLHSSQLEYLGVIAGMGSWCKEFSERQGVQIDYKHEAQSPLPGETGLCLFRVLQEALHNAAKHSGASRIEVELSEESGEIHLTIRDFGKGFDVESVKQAKGLGLVSMRERVRLVDGTITIDSKPMGGTTIRVRVPLPTEQDFQRVAG
jgi:PAS domain S-box-containing protein